MAKVQYNYVQQEYGAEFNVFAPPMAQALYAEIVDIETPECAVRELIDAHGSTVGMGYTHMYETYYDKNDGISWNNYFIADGVSMAPCPSGWHVSNYFPGWMTEALTTGQKIGIISEADLCAYGPDYCKGRSQVVAKGQDVAVTASALRQFFQNEFDSGRAKYIVAWLLHNDFPDAEIDWHEAYRDDGTPRQWFFAPWWSKDERQSLYGGVK